MIIDGGIVGTELAPYTHTVGLREIANYAAAIDDMNDHYHDDTAADRLVAPPVFPVVVTWPVIMTIGEQLGTKLPPEILATMVHALEHIVWHRPLRPDGRLEILSRVEAVVPRRAGTLVVVRLDASDKGAPIFTEYTGAMLRGVECSDSGRGQERLPKMRTVEGDPLPLWEHRIEIPRRAPYLYDGCTGIVFAIHTSPATAQAVGLPDIILQGTATLALAAREIVNHEASRDPLAVKEIACRFSDIVVPGTAISVQLLARQEEEGELHLAFRVINAAGKPAVKEGYARLSRGD